MSVLRTSVRNDREEDLYNESQSLIKDLSSGKIQRSDFEKKIALNEANIQDAVKERDVSNLLLERATLVGSAGIGAVGGLLMDLQTSDIVSPVVPPLLASSVVTAAVYYVLNNDNDEKFDAIAKYGKSYIGRPVLGAQQSVQQSVESYVENKKRALRKKITTSIDYVTSAPTNVKTAIIRYFQSKTDEVKAIVLKVPLEVTSTINQKVSEVQSETSRAVQAQVEKLTAAPAQATASAKEKLDRAVAYATALPTAIAERIKASVTSTIDGVTNSFNSKVSALQASFKAITSPTVRSGNSVKPYEQKKPQPSAVKAASQAPSKIEASTIPASTQGQSVVTQAPQAAKSFAAGVLTPFQRVLVPPTVKPPAVAPVATASDVKAAAAKTSDVKRVIAPTHAKPPAATSVEVTGDAKQSSKVVSAEPAAITSSGFNFGGFQLKLPTGTATVKTQPSAATAVNSSSVKPEPVKTVFGQKKAPAVAAASAAVKPVTNASAAVKPVAAAVKPVAAAVKPVAAAVKPVANAPAVVKVSASPTANLNGKIVKLITSTKNVTPTAVADIDRAFENYTKGLISPDRLYRELAFNLGSKDAAFEVLPELVGSLPKGSSLKTALYSYYQQNA